MARLDARTVVMLGGTHFPNRTLSDVWLLKAPDYLTKGCFLIFEIMVAIDPNETNVGYDALIYEKWEWREVNVSGVSPVALWSHQGALVGDNMVVLCRSPTTQHRRRTPESSSPGALTPPRKKLLSTRSLDEKEPPKTSNTISIHPTHELHRCDALSIDSMYSNDLIDSIMSAEPHQSQRSLWARFQNW